MKENVTRKRFGLLLADDMIASVLITILGFATPGKPDSVGVVVQGRSF